MKAHLDIKTNQLSFPSVDSFVSEFINNHLNRLVEGFKKFPEYSIKHDLKFISEFGTHYISPITISCEWGASNQEIEENLENGINFKINGYLIEIYGHQRFLKTSNSMDLVYEVKKPL